jgi:arylformamidase
VTDAETAYWDDAYTNSTYIPGGDAYRPKWAAAAEAFRNDMVRQGRAQLDQAYGAHARERFDVFLPEGTSKGTFIFIHGGYWMAFDKSSWSHLAAGALAHGWTVALPSYTLCPDVRITDIVAQVGRAVATIAARVGGPLRLAGHSAGGHLVSRLNCADSPVPAAVRDRVAHTISISGLHDLRPFLKTTMNKTLRLDAAEAARESPALLMPLPGARVTCWVGTAERPEFLRQNALLANVWSGVGGRMAKHEAEGRHHFDVVEELANPGAPLVSALLDD